MLYKYLKVTDEYTTYTLVAPPTEDMESSPVTELATIDGWTYVSTPEGMTLPPQPPQVTETLTEVEMTDELKAQLESASPVVQFIREQAANKIQAALSINDELKLIRDEIALIQKALNMSQSKPYADGDKLVKEVRDWAEAQKAAVGLGKASAEVKP